jgi:hypothetical protein
VPIKSSQAEDEELIVVPNGGTLPKLCVICGQTGQEPPLRFSYSWNPHGYQLGGKSSTFFAVATNRRARVRAFYCEKHRPRVLRNCLVMLAIGISSLSVRFALRNTHGLESLFAVLGCLIGVITVFACLMYYAMPPILMKCKRIEGDHIWFYLAVDKARKAHREALADSNPAE